MIVAVASGSLTRFYGKGCCGVLWKERVKPAAAAEMLIQNTDRASVLDHWSLNCSG
jgi:hypothetical protein